MIGRKQPTPVRRRTTRSVALRPVSRRGLTLVEVMVVIIVSSMVLLPLSTIFVSIVQAQQEADELMSLRRDLELVDVVLRERIVNATSIDNPSDDGHEIAFRSNATLQRSRISYDPVRDRLTVDGYEVPVEIVRFQIRKLTFNQLGVAFTVQEGEETLDAQYAIFAVNAQRAGG